MYTLVLFRLDALWIDSHAERHIGMWRQCPQNYVPSSIYFVFQICDII